MKLRVLIADDERFARLRLRELLGTDVEIVAECPDGKSAVQAALEHNPDVLLLDIQMPGLDGFGVLERLGTNSKAHAIFTTAHEEHAIRAFEACALDYLLKPISSERLAVALHRVRQRLEETRAATPAPRERMAHIQVCSRGRIQLVPAAEIHWIESAGNYAILHAGKENHIIRETLSSLESRLAPHDFLRANRSTLVNLSFVREVECPSNGGKSVLFANGIRLPLTRNVSELRKRLRKR